MRVLLTVALLLVPAVSLAGIQEKKAIAASEKRMNEELVQVSKACGNAKLKATIDWSAWEKYAYKDKDEKAAILGYVGGLIAEIYGFLESTCTKDELYKSEIAKLTVLAFSGKPERKEYDQAAFKLKGTTLVVSLNGDGVGSWKNEEAIKAVWE